jgi:glutathione synthase/RimK-type ligase-like ATP-grasp enzyme
MELDDGGFTVHEINPGTEFKALNECVDVNVPSHIINWIESVANKKGETR